MKLFAYQETGAAWLASRKAALLADEMGLGKTAQAITAADRIGAKRVLVICPSGLRHNIQQEFSLFGTLPRSVHLVTTTKDKIPDADLVICSYDLATYGGVQNQLLTRRFDLLICDEAHYMKNREAQRTRAVLGPKCNRVDGLAGVCDRLWLLTGTPMPNTADELWSLCRGIDATAVSYWTFRKTFCEEVQTGFGWKIVGLKNGKQLKAGLAQHMLRRRKADVLTDLPAIRFADWALDVPPNELKEVLTAQVGFAPPSEDVDVLAWARDSTPAVARLRAITGFTKARTFATAIADELTGAHHKIVIFAYHKETIALVAEALAPFGVVTITGDTPVDERHAAVQAFQTDPKIRVFIGNIIAAGTGLTLTAASDVAFLETTWVPSDVAQAAMRVHRIGQKNAVLVRLAYLAGSIDEHVTRAVRRKAKDIADIMENTNEI